MPSREPDVYEIPYRIGQSIKIGATDKEALDAVIVGICVQGEITFNCAWYSDGQRRTGWISRSEIRGNPKATQTVIGFTNHGNGEQQA